MSQASMGVAGVNTFYVNKAVLGVAGIDSPRVFTQHQAGIGVAGNWGSQLRPHIDRMMAPPPVPARSRLGDRAAEKCWTRACYFLDYTYVVCTDGEGGVRYRRGFEERFSPANRKLPVRFDCAAYREWMGTAPKWSGYDSYCKAIDLVKPDSVMAKDVVGDQQASLRNYQRMCNDGYADITIPVWQMGSTWDDRATDLMGRQFCVNMNEVQRTAIANARLAARDPVLQYYASRSGLIAIGGMIKGPCPREVRHLYLAELCRQFPDHQFWALGQASAMVINGLGSLGLLDRVSTDGSWWIHHARTEQMAIMQDGRIKAVRLTNTGAESFFTLSEMMSANLRSLLSAYAGLWTFPAPDVVPTDMRDEGAREELKQRLQTVQLDLFSHLTPPKQGAS